MASSPNRPASEPALPEDSLAVFANPPFPSPNPPDSIDEMLDMGRVESGDDSLTSKETKWDRDEGDVVEDGTLLKSRHSSQNQTIGSGSGARPEDPAHIVDKDDDDVEGEAKEGDAPTISLTGVRLGPLSSFHDGRIVPNSVCTSDTLTRLRRNLRGYRTTSGRLSLIRVMTFTPPLKVVC